MGRRSEVSQVKNRRMEEKHRVERKAYIKALIDKYGGLKGQPDQVDMDELRVILTKLENGVPPMPKDLLWVMSVGDKDGSGELGKGELNVVLNKWDKYKEEHESLVTLIAKHDKNKDMKLSDDEMLELLKAVTGSDKVTSQDVQYSKAVGKIDEEALAKAISIWDDEANISEGMFEKGIFPDFVNAEGVTFTPC